jgi:hypothetical protein
VRRYSTGAYFPIWHPSALDHVPTTLGSQNRQQCAVSVNDDCRHYIMQTTSRGEKVERCRMSANEHIPFACPDGCLFYEPRNVSAAGWTVKPRDDQPER